MTSSTPLATLRVRFGPLQYEIRAYDDRSEALLGLIQQQLFVAAFPGQPERIIHLLTYETADEDFELLSQSMIPPRLAAIVPAELPATGWQWGADELGYCSAWHPETMHGFWIYDAKWANLPTVYQIPWQFMTPDLCQRSGGILHGGLALHGGRGYLFTAPPGGGKSTALSRLPAPWEVLSDDAALVWFDAEGHPWASPLPTWSALLGRGSMLSADHIPKVAETVPIAGVLLLQKARFECIVTLPPIEAAAPLYRALCEHPAMLKQRRVVNSELFHCACELARKAPVWQLELRKDGAFWETLAEVV